MELFEIQEWIKGVMWLHSDLHWLLAIFFNKYFLVPPLQIKYDLLFVLWSLPALSLYLNEIHAVVYEMLIMLSQLSAYTFTYNVTFTKTPVGRLLGLSIVTRLTVHFTWSDVWSNDVQAKKTVRILVEIRPKGYFLSVIMWARHILTM